ncbi:2-oxo acid dehydrogenase subunit E2 [Mycobacterium lacus]|nr:dihydrolipoamide acetyltransferase family protein [Mycobacterium lacus]MCV7123134.1 2-oxo acid dehydrogenase subunit E2 [Mycobacterium lacus]
MVKGRIQAFTIPDLGEGLEEVTVTCWNVVVGDHVELNQTLCSVETAKAEVEIPSPYAGRVVEIGGAVGDVLKVGAMLVRIDTQPAAGDSTAGAAPNGESSTHARAFVGYGADDAFDRSRRAAAARPKAKPAVRKLAAELHVDLTEVPPGPDGLVSREAVLAAAGAGDKRPGATYDVLPIRGVQAHMAERMALSHGQIPDAQASVQVDCTNLLRVCDRLGVLIGNGEARITPFVLTLRLLVIALTHNAILNATWVDSAEGPQVHVHHSVHLGFAVATKRGLLVPVISDAQAKSTSELACRAAELTSGARDGTLTPAELRGSTFTVSNFGALGVDEGVPVINHPEAAILGMGAIKPRPVAVADEVVVRPTMTLTCVFDHRVADGAQVAHFLCQLRDLVESPEIALVDL